MRSFPIRPACTGCFGCLSTGFRCAARTKLTTRFSSVYTKCIIAIAIIHNAYNFVKMSLKTLVGSRMKECRIARGMTQAQVAAYLGVAQPVYQRYEKGTFECNYEQLVRLCELFDVSADFLLWRSDI